MTNLHTLLGGAEPAQDGTTYRWLLWRAWDPDLPSMVWVMLNPSTASATRDDPTIARCVGFAKAWGYGRIDVVNLYALRATKPRALWTHPDPVGEHNDRWIRRATQRAGLVVAAWGAHGERGYRAAHVAAWLGDLHPVYCLGTTRSGQPRHPLYVPGATTPQVYVPPGRVSLAPTGESP